MAKIVDVTDVPEFPGAGLLHFDDGRPPLMALPEIADEHRERLGISALQQGVAGPGAPDPDAWKTQFGGTLGKVLPDSPPAAPAPSAAAPPPPASAQGATGVPPALARPEEPPAPAAPAAPAEPEDPAIAASNARLAQDLIAGRQTGGPVAPARPAGFSPDIKKTVTEAGPAYDPRAAGERLDAGNMVLDAQLAKAAAEKQNADAMAAHATAANIAAQQQAQRQQAEMLRKQQAFQQQDASLQKDLADYSESAKPDPSRYWSTPGGAFSGFLSIIGQALGAFGATLGHTENFAMKAAQQKIQLEMAAQEKAYDGGRGDRKNALARLSDYYHGDMDMARLALQQSLNKVAETETQRFAAQSQSKEITANAQLLAAQFQQQQLLAEQQRAELAAGKTTTTVEDKYHQASGGGPGGKPLTLEQELAIRKFLKPKEGKDQGALGLTARTVATAKTQYGTKKEQIARLYSALDEEAKLLGLAIDKDTGTLVDPATGRPAREPLKSPGIGYVAGHVPDVLAGEEGRALRRARANSARLHAQTIYDKSITAEEAEHEIPTVMGKSPADEMNSLKQRLHELSQYDYQLDTTAASIDPRIVNERTEAKKNVNTSRATGQPLQGPAPRPGADTSSDDSGSSADVGSGN